MVRVADLKHGIGENLQELLHLEGGWPFMRLRQLKLHRGIGFDDDRRELGRHEQGDSGYNFTPHLHQLCEMHINGIQTTLFSFLLPIQFIVIQRYSFGLALLSYIRPNKGMLKHMYTIT